MKGHCPFPPYLPLSIFIPLISPYLCLGIGIGHAMKGCTLPCGKKGLKAQRVLIVETFEMLRPGILEKAVKSFSVRKGNLLDK